MTDEQDQKVDELDTLWEKFMELSRAVRTERNPVRRATLKHERAALSGQLTNRNQKLRSSGVETERIRFENSQR